MNIMLTMSRNGFKVNRSRNHKSIVIISLIQIRAIYKKEEGRIMLDDEQ